MGAGEAGAGPLTSLADALRRARPPSLSALVMLVEDVETYQDFLRLVDEYLPDQRQNIIEAGSPGDMVALFADLFSKQYFPLADQMIDGEAESLTDLMRFIPIDVEGYDYDDYDSLCNEFPQYLLGTLLFDFEEEIGLEGEGIRVTILEAAARDVSQEILSRIPKQGHSLDFLERALSGTKYEGLLDHARHLCHKTDTVFMDVTMEEFWSNPPTWCTEEVVWLTAEWRKAGEIHERMRTFFGWLEKDLEGNFALVLAFLAAVQPPEQLRLPGGEADG